MTQTRFTLTQQHITLLQHAYIGWQGCETGAPEIDPKRPYGNSSVAEDIAELLGVTLPDSEEQEDEYERERHRLLAIHYETETALQIILCCKTFEPGVFEKVDKYNSRLWSRV